jgi:hypothetical protein
VSRSGLSEEEETFYSPVPECFVAAEIPQARPKGVHVARASELEAGAKIDELLPPDLLVIAGNSSK